MRQAEGIKIAKEKGIHMGRPKYVLPDNFKEITYKFCKKQLILADALKQTKMKKSTFFKYFKIYKTKINH